MVVAISHLKKCTGSAEYGEMGEADVDMMPTLWQRKGRRREKKKKKTI